MINKFKASIIFKKNKMFSSIIALVALSIVFLCGSFNSETKLENIAEYASQIVKQTDKEFHYCCLTVGRTEESGDILDPESEFHSLYGTFKQQNITFASAVNPNKTHDIFIDGISDNLSMLYIGPVGTKEYDGHYKHYVSPMEVMFPDERNYDILRYVAYISQTHADRLLELRGASKDSQNHFSEEDYHSLLKTIIPFEIDGQSFDFLIQNIYYQTNYYYEGLNDVMGDFVMVSYYLPLELRREQRNMYFLNKYSYENKYFLKYINSGYYSGKFDLKVNTYNLNNQINEKLLLSFYYSESFYSLDWLSSLLFSLSGILMLLSLALLFYRFKKEINKHFYIFHSVILLLPYCLFGLIFMLFGNTVFFSEISARINAIYILVYFTGAIILGYISHTKVFKKELDLYEMDI